nr:P-type conjugative transfer protein TrbG [Agrobacterium larrymoorei]
MTAGFPQQIEYADPRVVRATLGSFVSNFRSVTPDAVVQKQYIDRTYALLRTSDPSTQKVNAWFRGNSPFEKAKTSTVAIEVNNIVALSNQTYQIDWTEYERDRKGKETGTRRFRGIATVALTAPQDAAIIRLNPIGLYVIFLYGEIRPSVVCSPLQVCDIELQGGEVVRDVLVGDTVRWKVETATSGAAGGQAIHLIVKPSEPGLVTSMVVTTSRRTYHIQLKSHPTQYMARVGFEYPEDVSSKLADVNARLEASTIPGAGVPAEHLSFSYSISGSVGWRPTRVYSDGLKTYIQFPRSISGQDAPVLFVVSGGQNRIVNYRMKNNVMVVDYNIDRAVLVSGVGWKQQKVTISRGGR